MRPPVNSFIIYLILSLSGFLFLNISLAFPQMLPGKKLIAEFKRDDVQQTLIFGDICGDMLNSFDEDEFTVQAKTVQKYLQKNDDDRVRIRMFMYERCSYLKREKPDPFNTAEQYLEMIKLAIPLEDEQLLSELYNKYAAVCTVPSKKMYYILKCIEMRERIGIKYFSDLSGNYYDASYLLYNITDYKSSASYAARSLNMYDEIGIRDYLFQYILVADMAAASYIKINKPDSGLYYYKHIGNLLEDRIANPTKYKSPMTSETLAIWQGVVKGGIGKAYLLQKKYDAAYSLLLENLKSSTVYQQWNDVAEVQNELAKIDGVQGRIPLAISRYVKAYRLTQESNKLPILIDATEGASSTYAMQKQYDSAYAYHKRYLHWKEIINENISRNRLEVVKAQLGFETLQQELLQSQSSLTTQKYIRNSILIAIACLTIIALLLYNRKHLRMSLHNEKLEREKQQSDAQIANAQQQIDFFMQNIAEKNELIKHLQTKLVAANTAEVNHALSHFTILTEEDWQKFKTSFETINPGFSYRLKQKMPQITRGEQRIVFLAKLGLNTKEMANATGVSSETIRSVSCRMRKKFNLNTDLHIIAEEI
jgi:DNA-binding CsgD family transcriptional regulator